MGFTRSLVALRRSALLAACGITLGASCRSGSDTPQLTTPTPPILTTTTVGATATTVDATQRAVLDGYRAFWAAFLRAADPMNPAHPDLRATATGAQLESVQKAFLASKDIGEVVRGTLDLHPRLSGPVTGTTASVADCYADSTHVFDAATGAQKDPPETVTERVTADMTLVDGAWKVAAMHHEATGCTPA